MDSQLGTIASMPQKDKTQAYIALLNDTLRASHNLPVDLMNFLDTILQPDFPQIVARPTLSEYVNSLKCITDRDIRKEIMGTSLRKIQPRATTYDEQVSTLREIYADLLEEDEEWNEAAKVLIGIALESGIRSTEYKLKVYIRIVRLYLEDEDSTSAETYFNRASLISHGTTELETQLQFKLCQARMFDFSRRFVEAASKYHEISYIAALDETDRINSLTAAITCAILAPAGPQRSRILSALYRDERSSETKHFTILSKMFLDQTIRAHEVEEFAATLSSHQLARLPSTTAIVIAEDAEIETGKKGPETVLDRAVMEHNVLGASRVYNNITFAGLGHLLGLRPSAAEAMARTMIHQGRLRGSIDQEKNLIIFDVDSKEGDGVVSNVAAAAAAAGPGLDAMDELIDEQGTAPATRKWDLQIRQTLQLAETVAARCEALLAAQASKA